MIDLVNWVYLLLDTYGFTYHSAFSVADKIATQLKVKNNLSALPVVDAQRTHADTIDF